MDRVQGLHKRPHPIQVGLTGLNVQLQIDFVNRGQLGEVGVDELRVVAKTGLLPRERLQLVEEQLRVDRVVAKAPAVLVLQILDDMLDQSRVIGALEAAQQVPALFRRDRTARDQSQSRIFDPLQRARILQRALEQSIDADPCIIEPRRRTTLLLACAARVVEAQIQLTADVLQCLLRIPFVVQQGLAVHQLARLRYHGAVVAANPTVECLLVQLALPGVLVVNAAVIVVLVRARNELLEHLGPVLGERKGLHVSNLFARPDHTDESQQQNQHMTFHKIHSFRMESLTDQYQRAHPAPHIS